MDITKKIEAQWETLQTSFSQTTNILKELLIQNITSNAKRLGYDFTKLLNDGDSLEERIEAANEEDFMSYVSIDYVCYHDDSHHRPVLLIKDTDEGVQVGFYSEIHDCVDMMDAMEVPMDSLIELSTWLEEEIEDKL